MRDYLPFMIIGLTTGGVYAVASLGLVLTYRTSGVFNFAHGAIGMFCTYLFYSLRQNVPTPVAVLVTLLVIAPAMGVVIDLMFRRLAGAGPTASIVASLGLLVGLQGLAIAIYGGHTRRLESIFPTDTYRSFDVNIGIDQTMIFAIAVITGLALMIFFRATPMGLRTRAVVDNRAMTELVGTSANAVTRFSWMLGCTFAAASGILFAPLVGLDSVVITLLVVEAFGAAAIGRLQSFPRTMLGAFGLGVTQSIATKVVAEIGTPSLTGFPSAIPFLMLFLVLVFSRGDTLREAPVTRPATRKRLPGPRFRFPLRGLAATFAIAAMLPAVVNATRLVSLTLAAAFLVVFASLSLLIGVSRQLSLCHAAFVVFGATTFSHLQSAEIPYLLALPLAGLVVVPIGAAMAFPAIRLSSLYLGLATFGFGILAQNLLFPTAFVFGVDSLARIERPGFLSGDTGFYYFTMIVALLAVGAVEFIRISRLGRMLTALADSPKAVGSLGVSPLAARMVAFCVSAFLAGMAGALIGSLFRSVNPASFTFFHSLLWVTVLVLAGAQTFSGVVLAAASLVIVPTVFTSSLVTEWQPVVFGAAAIALARTDNGLVGILRAIDFTGLAERSRWRLGSQRGRERLGRLAGVQQTRMGVPQ